MAHTSFCGGPYYFKGTAKYRRRSYKSSGGPKNCTRDPHLRRRGDKTRSEPVKPDEPAKLKMGPVLS